MKHTKAYDVFVTSDYSLFNSLEGNREVTNGRKKKIINSIHEIGWIKNPIIVNEKMEIIDGQGRFEACKELGFPIEYVIDEGIGIEECRSMNIYQVNWTLRNYVESFSDYGNDNYVRLNNLLSKYSNIGSQTVIYAATFVSRRASEDLIKEGRLSLNEKEYKDADRALAFINSIFQYLQKVEGHRTVFYAMVVFTYLKCASDANRLKHVLVKKITSVNPIASYENALREIERIYNQGYRGKYANFYNEYKEYTREKRKAEA